MRSTTTPARLEVCAVDADDLARCKANHPAYWWARRRQIEQAVNEVMGPPRYDQKDPRESA